jgi:hypothetical protein
MAEDNILLSTKGMEQLEKYLERLANGDLKKSNTHALQGLAHRVRDAVRKGYQDSAYARTEGTLQAYAHGKAAGSTPSRRTWGGKSLMRSGLLAKSILVRQMTKGWQVQVDPKATYGGDATDEQRGLRLERIAAQLENPKPIIIKVTQAMKNYLAMIRGGGGSPSGKTTPVGSTILIQMEAKPVWKPVFDKVRGMLPAYTKIMEKHLKQRGARRFPGMKIS